jgi:hypothetical protein
MSCHVQLAIFNSNNRGSRCGITLRSPAGDFSEGAQNAPSQLLLKGFRRDGFLEHRA